MGRRMLRCNRGGPDINPCSFFTMYPHCDCGESAEKNRLSWRRASNSLAVRIGAAATATGAQLFTAETALHKCCCSDGRLGSANPSQALPRGRRLREGAHVVLNAQVRVPIHRRSVPAPAPRCAQNSID